MDRYRNPPCHHLCFRTCPEGGCGAKAQASSKGHSCHRGQSCHTRTRVLQAPRDSSPGPAPGTVGAEIFADTAGPYKPRYVNNVEFQHESSKDQMEIYKNDIEKFPLEQIVHVGAWKPLPILPSSARSPGLEIRMYSAIIWSRMTREVASLQTLLQSVRLPPATSCRSMFRGRCHR